MPRPHPHMVVRFLPMLIYFDLRRNLRESPSLRGVRVAVCFARLANLR